jgi:hypothetical protein
MPENDRTASPVACHTIRTTSASRLGSSIRNESRITESCRHNPTLSRR